MCSGGEIGPKLMPCEAELYPNQGSMARHIETQRQVNKLRAQKIRDKDIEVRNEFSQFLKGLALIAKTRGSSDEDPVD
jgi:hypothetical protein